MGDRVSHLHHQTAFCGQITGVHLMTKDGSSLGAGGFKPTVYQSSRLAEAAFGTLDRWLVEFFGGFTLWHIILSWVPITQRPPVINCSIQFFETITSFCNTSYMHPVFILKRKRSKKCNRQANESFLVISWSHYVFWLWILNDRFTANCTPMALDDVHSVSILHWQPGIQPLHGEDKTKSAIHQQETMQRICLGPGTPPPPSLLTSSPTHCWPRSLTEAGNMESIGIHSILIFS